jgi:hypothetical protein
MAMDATVKLKGGVEMLVPAAVIEGFSDEVYNAIFAEGLKVMLSKGLAGTKEDKITVKDVEKIEAKAKQNLQNLVDGKVKAGRTSTKVKGISREVAVAALALAKTAIKQEAKRQKIKVSHIDSKDLTRWAKELLESDQGPALIAQAKANIEQASNASLFTGISLGIHSDDRKAEKANKKAQETADKKAAEKAKAGAFVPQKGAKPAQHASH